MSIHALLIENMENKLEIISPLLFITRTENVENYINGTQVHVLLFSSLELLICFVRIQLM